jgi:hypothetical protein
MKKAESNSEIDDCVKAIHVELWSRLEKIYLHEFIGIKFELIRHFCVKC